MEINNFKGKCIKYNVSIFLIGLPYHIFEKHFPPKNKNLSPLSFSQVFIIHHTESPSFQSTLPKLSLHYPSLSRVSQVVLPLQMFSEIMTSKIYASFSYSIYLIFNIITLLRTPDCLLNYQILIFFLKIIPIKSQKFEAK